MDINHEGKTPGLRPRSELEEDPHVDNLLLETPREHLLALVVAEDFSPLPAALACF